MGRSGSLSAESEPSENPGTPQREDCVVRVSIGPVKRIAFGRRPLSGYMLLGRFLAVRSTCQPKPPRSGGHSVSGVKVVLPHGSLPSQPSNLTWLRMTCTCPGSKGCGRTCFPFTSLNRFGIFLLQPTGSARSIQRARRACMAVRWSHSSSRRPKERRAEWKSAKLDFPLF